MYEISVIYESSVKHGEVPVEDATFRAVLENHVAAQESKSIYFFVQVGNDDAIAGSLAFTALSSAPSSRTICTAPVCLGGYLLLTSSIASSHLLQLCPRHSGATSCLRES